MIDYVNTNMVAVKMHLEEEEGKTLVDHYKVKAFPSIIFVDIDSMEVDRIVGYLPPVEFLAEIKRVQSGVGTIPDLINKTISEPSNFDQWLELAGKYEDRGDLVSARDVYSTVAGHGIGDIDFVYYKLVELNSFVANDVTDLEIFIAENLNSEYADYAFQGIISIMRKNKDIEGEADAWKRYMNLLEIKKSYTASIYNSFAWRMSQLEINLDDALEKIRAAIKLTKSYDRERVAGFKDTEAEVLWKMGNIEEAVKVIDESIKLQPNDDYFKKQREKFLK